MVSPHDVAVLVRRMQTLTEATAIVRAAQREQREELAKWLENPRMTRSEMIEFLRAAGD